MKRFAFLATVLLLNVLAFGMLGLYQRTVAGSPSGPPMPFANTTESRLEMIQQLKEIRDLLKEQNALLRSGEVKVIVTELPKVAEEARPVGPATAPADAAPPAPGAPVPIEDPK
jgi:hypothetical protein